ncbi:hypothetical protein NEILACOT_05508 [Neisseria lactamica ATCC 23970]|uniref:Uncharacterized protein n=1 Tax=Neisseria lactamica ATCC 23970 TaxID=546265 RepID=D0WD72_NEILA|nr:hypothetical protein NEILACOT_05508 [Neisseria lactamica ATCC 23970]
MREFIGKKGFFRFYVLDSHFRGNDGPGVSDDSGIPMVLQGGLCPAIFANLANLAIYAVPTGCRQTDAV